MSVDLWFLDDIRDAVNSPETADPELLREASVAYNDACRQTNARLRDIEKLLQRGLRSEAIQTAEQEPTLLELVADLDFPVSEEWQGMLAQWGLQLPPPLERDIASRLNAAYAELQPLEQLMRQHRLLALARAPLAARIEVLRRIGAKDDMNLSWKSDLLGYERQRIREMRAEALEANRREDLVGLAALREELSDTLWLCEVPQDVVQEVEGLHHTLAVAEARKALEQLVPKLHEAYSELDVTGAIKLADRWIRHATSAGLSPSDPLSQQVEEALQWVHQQRQAAADEQAFQQSLDAIEQALDKYKSLNELDRLFHKAERFGMPMPDLLRNRVAERLGTLRGNARRRGLLIGTVSTVAAILLIVATFLYWRVTQQRDLVAQHVQHLTELVDQARWEQAEEYLEKLPGTTQQAPEVIALQTKVSQGLHDESDRAQAIESMLSDAEKLDPGSLDEARFRQIGESVRTPEEKRRLVELERKLRQFKNERQTVLDEAFLKMVKKWSEILSDFERRENLEGVELWGMLTQLELELSQHSRVTADLKKRGTTLTNKLRAIIDQKTKGVSEQKALQRVFSSVGESANFVEALEDLVETQPDTMAASHARQLLDDQKAWLSAIHWTAFWEAQRETWNGLSPDEAAIVLSQGDKLQADTLKNELSRAFEDRRAHLQAVVARKDVDLVDLKSLLIQNSLVSDVWLVVEKKGERFYCPREPTLDTRTSIAFLSYEYFIDFTKTTPRRSGLKFLKEYNDKPYALSPQAECAQACSERLADLSDANWDNTFGAMALVVRKHVEAEPALDEVLALDMLRNILMTGSEGSFSFAQTFAPVVAEIENSGIDLSVAWFLPGDKDAETARRDARAVITGLADFRKLWQGKSALRRTRCQPPEDQISWVGVLDRGPNESWVCQPALPPTANGELLVAATTDASDVKLTPVAEVRSGKVTWDAERIPNPPLISTPLFLRLDASSNL